MKRIRKRFLLAALCALQANGTRAEVAPNLAASSGLTEAHIESLRNQAALWDQIKNIFPHINALPQIARQGVPGAVNVIRDGVADYVAEAITGAQSPNIAVTTTLNTIIETSRRLDAVGGEWRRIPAPLPELRTNAPEMRPMLQRAQIGQCPPIAPLGCMPDIGDTIRRNPFRNYVNRCVVTTGRLDEANARQVTSTIYIVSCNVVGNRLLPTVIGHDVLPPDTRFRGYGYVGFCLPCQN